MKAERIKKFAGRFLPRGGFARNVSLLAGGAAAGQIIVVAASPALTRLYTPEDFGILAVFSSLLAMIGIIASLRYQLAIPLPETDKDAAGVTALSLLLVLGLSALTAAIIIPFRNTIADALNTPLLAEFIWLLPLGLLLQGIYEVLNYWAIRNKAFGTIAQTKMTQSLGMVGVQVGGYPFGPIALLIGKVVGQAAGIHRLGKDLANNKDQFKHVRLSLLVSSARKYRSFPLISTWNGLASSGGTQLPPLLIAILLGPVSAGLYALTNRVLSLPIGIVSKSMGDVFYKEAIEANARGDLGALVVDIYSKMVSASLPMAIVFMVSAPELFRIFFGESWLSSGELASWMMLWIFFQFITTPPGRVFLILNRHGSALYYQAAFLVVTVISITIGGIWFEDLVAIMVILAFGRSAVYCFRFCKILTLVDESIDKLWTPIIRKFPISLLCSTPAWLGVNAIEVPNDYLSFGLIMVSMLMASISGVRVFFLRR